jgi:uncharacterized delta-60 repeat protein
MRVERRACAHASCDIRHALCAIHSMSPPMRAHAMSIRSRRCAFAGLLLAASAPSAWAQVYAADTGFGDAGLRITDFVAPADDTVLAIQALPDGRYYALGSSPGNWRLSRHLANGAVDPGFGVGGSALIQGFAGRALALQADGAIVVAGTAGNTTLTQDFALSRFLPDGQLDVGFGNGGITLTDFAEHADSINAVVIEPGGTILVAGMAHVAAVGGTSVALARYSASGQLLTARSTKLFAGTADILEDVHLLSDGRIIGIGYSRTFSAAGSTAVRFTADLNVDPGFGTAGVALLAAGGRENEAYAGALQADGSILLTGSIAVGGGNYAVLLARLLGNGTLDAGFGTGGWTETVIPGEGDAVGTGMVHVPGAIVVAVSTSQVQDFVLARYTAAGALDASFGTAGLLFQDFHGGRDSATTIALHSGGMIAAGRAVPAAPGQGADYGFARYSLAGVPDGSFGSGGLADTGFLSSVANRANALAIQPDGRILVGGYAGTSFPSRDFAISRHLQGGPLDPAFGAGGRVVVDFGGSEDELGALVARADGTVLAAGTAWVDGQRQFAVARFLGNGQPDTTFGTTGRVLLNPGQIGLEPLSMVVRPDGRILIAGGLSGAGGQNDFVVMGLTATGAVDNGFGTGGRTVVDMSGGSDFVTSMLLRPDGSILVGGAGLVSGSGFDMQVLRLLPGGAVDTGFGSGGKVGIDFAGRTDLAQAMVLVGSGASERLYVAGSAQLGSSSTSVDFAVVALDDDGALVQGFGTGGKATFDLGNGSADSAFGVLALDQRLVLAGSGPQGVASDLQLFAIDFNGVPDPGFSATGAQLAVGSVAQDEANAAAVDAQGRVLVAGWTTGGQGGQDFLLARVAPVVDLIFGHGFEVD